MGARYLRRLVGRFPDPPRHPSSIILLLAVYGEGVHVALTAAGISMVISAGLVAVFVALSETQHALHPVMADTAAVAAVVVAVLVAMAGTLLLVRPVLAFRTLRRAAAAGHPATAEVTSVRWVEAGTSMVLGSDRGAFVGRRVIRHPFATFTDGFAVSARWGRRLAPGSQLLVLIDPAEHRVLAELGPAQHDDLGSVVTR